MRIAGLQKCSLIDYPSKVSCVIFTQGCNFRCGYCHNPQLVLPKCFESTISESHVLDFLNNRKAYLDGVVISGGEPTFQADLVSFLAKIKQLGYLIKLDTNGSNPAMIKQLIQLKLINYIAMDVKAPLEKYEKVIGIRFPIEKIQASIDIIKHSGIHHEFRTTVVKSLCSEEDLKQVSQMIDGSERFRLQKARLSENILDKKLLNQEQYTTEEFDQLENEFNQDCRLSYR